ncbi:hypothetical protein PV327_001428 [Microctonus hyperodae]|uniref:Uncharacterized protein n=1 Tax=Microctonus hyperodae TaxID=165561 RepID=A0AA39GA75_MICHY|nr:hypothetical protein PV327_001428 [Microctonus hyperodae]
MNMKNKNACTLSKVKNVNEGLNFFFLIFNIIISSIDFCLFVNFVFTLISFFFFIIILALGKNENGALCLFFIILLKILNNSKIKKVIELSQMRLNDEKNFLIFLKYKEIKLQTIIKKFVISLISIFILANNDLIKIIFNIKYLMFKVIPLELHYYCNLIMEREKKNVYGEYDKNKEIKEKKIKVEKMKKKKQN